MLMNKLFKDIRQGNVEAVRKAIEKKPQVVNEIYTGSAPKKDVAQSPLQVALKCVEFEIIDILLENGADPDFMEDPKLVPPHSRCVPVLSDAIKYSMESLRYRGSQHYEESDKYVKIVERLLELGADPNKRVFESVDSPNNFSPLMVLLGSGNGTLKQPRMELEPQSYEVAKKNIFAILDLLTRYGVNILDCLDNEIWCGQSCRKAYLDPFSGEGVDVNRAIRVVLQEYFGKEN